MAMCGSFCWTRTPLAARFCPSSADRPERQPGVDGCGRERGERWCLLWSCRRNLRYRARRKEQN